MVPGLLARGGGLVHISDPLGPPKQPKQRLSREKDAGFEPISGPIAEAGQRTRPKPGQPIDFERFWRLVSFSHVVTPHSAPFAYPALVAVPVAVPAANHTAGPE